MGLDDGGSDCQLGVVEDCPVVLVEGGLLGLTASEGDCGLSCGLVGHFVSRNQFIFLSYWGKQATKLARNHYSIFRRRILYS